MTDTALILFAHGARDPAWAEPFRRVLARVEALAPDSAAVLAYLERMQPDRTSAIDLQVGRGFTDIRIVPLFLGPGGHVRDDVPQIVEAARERHPGVRFALLPPAGKDAGVVEALAGYCVGMPAANR